MRDILLPIFLLFSSSVALGSDFLCNPSSIMLKTEHGFVTRNQYVASMLGITGPAMVITDSQELRMLTLSQENLHIIIVTNKEKALDAMRTEKVLKIALIKGIKISTVWLNSVPSEYLSQLSLASGGVFIQKDCLVLETP